MLTQATKSSCVMFSPSKNLWKSTGGAAGRLKFHTLLEDGSVSLRRDTAKLYRAQLTLLRARFEPTTVYIERSESRSKKITRYHSHRELVSIQGEWHNP